MWPVGKLVESMLDLEMLLVAHIDKAVVSPPFVGVDDAADADLAADDALQRGLLAVGDDFRVYVPVTLEQAEDNGFAIGSAASFATHTPRPEVGLVNLDDAGLPSHGSAILRDDFTEQPVVTVDRVCVQL